MKKNPNKKPCSAAERDKIVDEAYVTAIACALSTIAETERLTVDEMHELWENVEKTSGRIAKGKDTLAKKVIILENRYKIKIGQIRDYTASTIGEVKKKAATAYRLGCSLILWELCELSIFDADEIKQIWQKFLYKNDSLKRGYMTLNDLCDALRQEYNINVINS